MNKDREQRIEQYVSGQLSAAERLAFEQELTRDASLQKEVAFVKGLNQFFAERNPALEDNLSNLGEEYFATEPKPLAWKKWTLGLGVLLILFAGIWWLIQDTSTPTVAEPVKVEESVSESATEQPPASNSEMDEKKEAATEKPQELPQKKSPKTTKPAERQVKQKPTSPPIAALNEEDFALNPVLEDLITERVRNESTTTEIEMPAVNAVLKYAPKTQLIIKGKTTAPAPYRLTIYRNRATDFDNDRKFLTTELNHSEEQDETVFSFNAKIDFKKGLYYFLIEAVETEELLLVSKFQVK